MTPLPLDEHEIERMLKEATATFAPTEAIRQHIRAQVLQKRRSAWSRTVGPVLALAASLLIAVALSFALLQPQSLYAQVTAALREVESAHIVGKRLKDGVWKQGVEVWYRRDLGVVQSSDAILSIDDGKHRWRYDQNKRLVIRDRSVDPMGLVAELLNLNHIKQFVRVPDQDRVIDGEQCMAVRREELTDKSGYRAVGWIDRQKRVRLWEEYSRDEGGTWTKSEIGEARYDTPIDANRFKTDFGPDVRIVDAQKLLDDRFPLDNPVFKTEKMGLIFAVHQLRSLENGMVLVVHSTRGTPETISRFGPIISEKGGGSSAHGEFMLGNSWKRVGGREWMHHWMHLATLYKDGMRVQWDVAVPRTRAANDPRVFELSAHVYTRGKLQESYTNTGKEWHADLKTLAELPLDRGNIALIDVAKEIHSEALLLQPAAIQVALYGHPVELSREEALRQGIDSKAWTQRTIAPDQISVDEYVGEVTAYLEHTRSFTKR